MKRIDNLYSQIISIDNLCLADQKARKGKSKQYGVIAHDKNRYDNIHKLHEMLASKTYRTSEYTTFKVFETKERDVYKLPYFHDRITHHAIMNIMEPIWVSMFTANTYSCIKGKGIHAAQRDLEAALKDKEGTKYCLKLDITKFYPSVDHDILKQILRKKIKDHDLLWLLDEIIDSAQGIPIGNYLSQYFANLYLTYFDHWIKEQKGVKYYFRYADDIVILSSDKPSLHLILEEIKDYLSSKLKLQVKGNYQVFPLAARSIDFVGYRFWHTHTLLRKSIKKAYARKMAGGANGQSIASYKGWVKHCNGINLNRKLQAYSMKKFGELTLTNPKRFTGTKIAIGEVLNQEIEVNAFRVKPSRFKGECIQIDINFNGENRLIFTGSESLLETLKSINKIDFPFSATIIQEFKRYDFK